jgi:hypothetical protein
MASQTIYVKYGLTINLGDNQFVRADTGLERQLGEHEDLDEAYKESWVKVLKETERMVRVARKRVK